MVRVPGWAHARKDRLVPTQIFRTTSLVEATLMFMLIPDTGMSCQWEGNKCTFSFLEAHTDDIKWATDAKTTVVAREFNHAMTTVKTAMYSAKHG